MPDYTPTQGRYLAFIAAYIDGFGLPPAESEIAIALGVSPPSVNQMMRMLEKKKLIRRQAGVARSIEILVPPEAVPRWEGKPLTRTVRAWSRSQRRRPICKTSKQENIVYRFKITLKESRPPIWRRIETTDVTLQQFHEQIQTAMGWTNSHLHQFEIDGERFSDGRFLDDGFGDFGAKDYSRVKLSSILTGRANRFIYEYDFGDGWLHDIVLEETIDADPKLSYPRCVAGRGACPPEDIGGVWGFANYVEAITNPDHEEYEELLEWNGPFDPEHFDPGEATACMKRGLPGW